MSELVSKFVEAAHFTPVSGGRVIDVIVIHAMENDEKPAGAENVAAWFAGSSAPRASAHYCIDNDSIVQCVKDSDVAWHAPGANHDGLGFEHAGRSSQRPRDWDDPYSRAELRLSAMLAAEKCRTYRIPPVYLRAADLVADRRGITTHAQVTRAFRLGDHTDPGKSFPIVRYVGDVAHLLRSGAPPTPPPVLVKAPPPTLRRGSSGWQVKRLQRLVGHVVVDGAFGPATEAAVEAFQRHAHLPPDGVVGPGTWGALLHAKFMGSA